MCCGKVGLWLPLHGFTAQSDRTRNLARGTHSDYITVKRAAHSARLMSLIAGCEIQCPCQYGDSGSSACTCVLRVRIENIGTDRVAHLPRKKVSAASGPPHCVPTSRARWLRGCLDFSVVRSVVLLDESSAVGELVGDERRSQCTKGTLRAFLSPPTCASQCAHSSAYAVGGGI